MTATETYPEIPEDFKLYFYTLGDVNQDGFIDAKDLALMTAAYGKPDTDADINGDGVVNLSDLVILSKNYGKNITDEWHKTYDAQQEALLESETTGATVVPWYIEWAREVAKLQAKNDKAYSEFMDPALQSMMDNLKGLAAMPDLMWKGHIDNADDMLVADIKANLKVKASVITDATSEQMSQDVADQMGLNTTLANYLLNKYGTVMGQLPQIRMADDKTACDQMDKTAAEVYEAEKDATIFNDVIDALSFGSVGFQKDFIALASKANIWDTMMTTPVTLRYQLGLVTPATQYLNTIFTPNIPAVGDLVKMYANAKITAEDYAETMLMNGWDEYWQAKYWEAHWTKPSVADGLTAWRRGKITDAELDEIMTNADLDPAWQAIWEQRKFNDISVGEAHTLYDVGLIDDARLLEVATRSGFNLDDAAMIAEGIKQFPVRRLKFRVLLALANASAAATLDGAQLAVYVGKLGYGQSVIDWLMLYGQIRQQMAANTVKKPKAKLLDTADLKKAFVFGLMTEDAVRTELQLRGYDVADVEILIELLNEQRSVETAGGKMKGLTVSELLNAWRYNIIDQTNLTTRLLTRGLSLEDVNILIAVKQQQWNITPKPAG